MDTKSEIELYDRAVYSYLSTISNKIVYAPTQAAKRTITKREEFLDNKPWNFISFFRQPQLDIDWNRMNNVGTVVGDFVKMESDSGNRVARYVQNIPVNLTYDINIWASKSVEVLKLATDLIKKIYMTDQVIFVPINPDGEDGRFHILEVDWTDNSDLERETEIGRIYRHTIRFMIDARLTIVNDINTIPLCEVPIDIYGGDEE